MKKTSLFILLFMTILAGCASRGSLFYNGSYPKISKSEHFRSTNVFKNPESVLFDPVTRQLFVSNVNGHPMQKDGNGFISKVAINGDVRDLHWLTGFNAPKGMTLIGDTLYVADIDQLVVVDITTNIKTYYPVPGAVFLNDVTHDTNGRVYISDLMTDTIHVFDGKTVSVWLHDEQLKSPNGLYVKDSTLYVGSWGRMVDGFKTKRFGNLLKIDIGSKEITVFVKELGNLDGLESFHEFFILTDFMAGSLFIVDPEGGFEEILDIGAGSADLCVLPEDWELLVIPMMNDNILLGYSISQ